MTNPYDVYNNNGAYFGWLKAVKTAREEIERLRVRTGNEYYDTAHNQAIDSALLKLEVDNDRFGYLLHEV